MKTIESVVVGLSVSGTVATCETVVVSSASKTKIELVLQRSANGGSSFSDYATLSSASYTDRTSMIQKTKSGLSGSYKYRLKVVSTGYNASGAKLDQNTTYSPVR